MGADRPAEELRAARKALALIKHDGHAYPDQEGCLSCEAVAEFEETWGELDTPSVAERTNPLTVDPLDSIELPGNSGEA